MRVVLIAAGFAVLAAPTWLQSWQGEFSAFPVVSAVYLLVIAFLVTTWGRVPTSGPGSRTPLAGVVAGGAGVVLVALAAYRFIDVVLLNPPDPTRGDMLTVIEQAGWRFLQGRNPYSDYQLPWEAGLSYGPPLWGPFMVPALLRLDLRLLTATGQLFIPICCGAAAVFEAGRARMTAAGAWTLLLAGLVFNPDLLRFVSVGHTPVYWPLLPLLAILIVGEHWRAAAAVLGVLVAGRATMTVMVPVLLTAVWHRDRPRALATGLVGAGVVTALLLPFFVWDPGSMWHGMINNYTERIKEIVWHSADQGAIRTIGLTGWLLSHGLERLVDLSQVAALAVVYPIAWRQLRRGASTVPLMALALFAFSMTTVWPVYYAHFDVMFLLTSAALAESAGAMSWRRALGSWPVVLASSAVLVAGTVLVLTRSEPSVVVAEEPGRRWLRDGFGGLEDDGARRYAWIDGARGVVLLPRSRSTGAEIVVTGRPFLAAGNTSMPVTAVLNDVPLGTRQTRGDWQEVRFQAPASAWRIGANELELTFPPARSPKELGLSTDARHLSMAIQRVDVRAE